MRKIVKEYEFWVTNLSKKNVSLSDLALTLKARTHANLLDRKHYSYSHEQLKESAESGSLYKKRDKIKVREVAPEIAVEPGIYVSNAPLFMAKNKNLRSTLVLEEPKFEELQISEESFADEMTDDE